MIDDDTDAPTLQGIDRDLDALCEAWIWWRREHRIYGRMLNFSAYGPLPGRVRPLRQPQQSFAAVGLAAFEVAYSCQPDALDKKVFDLYYIARVKPVKAAAAYLGIEHRQFYKVLDAFRRRVDTSAQAFASNTVATADGEILPLFGGDPAAVNRETVPKTGRNNGP